MSPLEAMNRPASLDRALRRMLEADDAKGDAEDAYEKWVAWQAAATDYWLMLHPELKRFRRGDGTTVPIVADMRARAKLISEAMTGIPDAWRLMPPSAAKAEHLARVGWWHELMAGLYDPVTGAIERIDVDRSAVETLVRFLEADVYCHRSGYTKDDVIRALTRSTILDLETRQRLRDVVVAIVDRPDRREFRAYVRLARSVDDENLRAQLRARFSANAPVVARHARWVLEGLGDRATAMSTNAGRQS
jgi:hypothetical protein